MGVKGGDKIYWCTKPRFNFVTVIAITQYQLSPVRKQLTPSLQRFAVRMVVFSEKALTEVGLPPVPLLGSCGSPFLEQDHHNHGCQASPNQQRKDQDCGKVADRLHVYLHLTRAPDGPVGNRVFEAATDCL